MGKKRTKALPVDFTADRPPTPPGQDFHRDAQHTLATPPLSPEVRAEALRRMKEWAPDLIEMLGLGEPKRVARPIDVACPICKAPPRRRCVSKAGNDIGHTHASRHRVAIEGEAAEVLADKILTEA